MIDEVDKDKNGQIQFEEFKLIMTKTIRDDFTQNASIEAFSIFDKNRTGTISRSELATILKTKGDHNLDEKDIEDLLKHIQFDPTLDSIDYKDFVKKTFELFK